MSPKMFTLLLLGLVLIPSVGCGLLENKDQVIQQVVKVGNQERAQIVTPDGIFGDYRVFREGETDEVIFEYKLKPDRQLTNPDQIKKDILALIAGDTTGESQSVLRAGVVFTFVYLSAEGNEVLRHSVSQENL